MEKFRCEYCGKKIDDILCPYCGGRNKHIVDGQENEMESILNQSYQETDVTEENFEDNMPVNEYDNEYKTYNIKPTSNKNYADISVMFGFLGLFMFGFIFGILAIIFSNKYIKTGEMQHLGKAKLGKIFGIISIIFSIFPIFTIIPIFIEFFNHF